MAGNNISLYAYVLEITCIELCRTQSLGENMFHLAHNVSQNKVNKRVKTKILKGNIIHHRWRYFTVR